MKTLKSKWSRENGFALVYMAGLLGVLLLFSGLAVDSGRAYVVRNQLTKAVDGAALAAARNLNSGNPRLEAEQVFRANFPLGFMGTSSVTDPTSDPGFFNSAVNAATGVNTVTVTASAVMPTSFMQLANLDYVTVRSTGEATRRMVDICLSLDVSSSLGWRWPYVRDAARTFISSFDQNNDRFALVRYSNGARVLDQMPSSRGFNKSQVMADVPDTLPGGSTAMVEGFYRCWDEVRTVPNGQQSGVRVIVLFTDGASNSVPGDYPAEAGIANGLRTWDFPKNFPDPDNQTHNSPHITGLYDTETGATGPYADVALPWNSTATLAAFPFLPVTSWHTHRRSAGIPTAFPLQTNALTVNGVPQQNVRGLRNWNAGVGRYPAEIFNINNSARNLLEIIADAARSDADGDYPIRVFTIGMGELVRYMLGTMPEQPEGILMRVANDVDSPDYNSNQLEGKYFFAATAYDVEEAFKLLQNELIRLTK